jgi:aminotransferase
MISLSKKSENIIQSEIRAMSIACREKNGINLAQGVCDMETPSVLFDGAAVAFNKSNNSYTQAEGIYEIRDQIAKKEFRDKGIVIDPSKNIVISNGATGAFYSAVLATLNPNDSVIVFEPYYGYHISTLAFADINIKYVKMDAKNNWAFSEDDIISQIDKTTRAFIINTPSNPSGKVFSQEELELIGDICARYNLFVISDEIYEHFVYDGLKHISPIQIEKLKNRTIVVSGFSKSFCITGWRVGYSIASEEISRAITQFSDLIYVCSPSILQHGVAAGLQTLTPEYYEKLNVSHQEKREIFCNTLSEIGLTPFVPHGSYYVLTDVSRIKAANSRERALLFLEKTGIAGVPGSAFYHDNSGDNYIRFCFAKEQEVINNVCEKLRSAKI